MDFLKRESDHVMYGILRLEILDTKALHAPLTYTDGPTALESDGELVGGERTCCEVRNGGYCDRENGGVRSSF